MSNHHDRDIILTSTIERFTHEVVTQVGGIGIAGGKNPLNVVILQHLRQAIRTE